MLYELKEVVYASVVEGWENVKFTNKNTALSLCLSLSDKLNSSFYNVNAYIGPPIVIILPQREQLWVSKPHQLTDFVQNFSCVRYTILFSLHYSVLSFSFSIHQKNSNNHAEKYFSP